MKLEIDLSDIRKERPVKTCDVLVFHMDVDGTTYHGITTAYSSRHDQFNDFTTRLIDNGSCGEVNGRYMYWAYFDEVKEAIRQAQMREEREKQMNTSTKCNCCAAEEVCKFKEDYESGVKQIVDMIKGNPIIEVSIKCPHMIPKSATPTFRQK